MQIIINFISPIGSQHKKNTKAKAQQQQTKSINQSIYQSVTTRRVSARLSMRKIGEHLTQHIAGLNNFFQKLHFALSNQHLASICQESG